MFVASFQGLGKDIHQTAVDHGWWENERSNGEIIALIHSELSEALEGLRSKKPMDEHLPDFFSVEVELADAIIRIMDVAIMRGWRVAEAVVEKARLNKTRPFKHGKKF